MTDWTDGKSPVSKYFNVREAIYLPKWSRLASAGDGLSLDAQIALRSLFLKMDLVREFLGVPIRVHVAFRPHPYNIECGGAKESAHIARREHGVLIAAVDWHADVGDDSPAENCETIRQAMLPKLEDWDLRLEDNGSTAPWIHTDTRPVPPGGHRFFRP